MRKNAHAQALGKLGGLARAKRMTREEQLESSRKANAAKKRESELRGIEEGRMSRQPGDHFTEIRLRVCVSHPMQSELDTSPVLHRNFLLYALWTTFTPGLAPGILDWFTVLMGVTGAVILTVHGAGYLGGKLRNSRATSWDVDGDPVRAAGLAG